jgi:membrane protease YdiL (CAAX protease family)
MIVFRHLKLESPMVSRQMVTRSLWFQFLVFALFIALLSAPGALSMAAGRSVYTEGRLLALVLMWAPGISGILVKWIFYRNLAGIGWCPGKFRYSLFAYACPLFTAGCVYGCVWWSGNATFSPEPFLVSLREQLGQPAITLFQAFVWFGTIGVVISLLSAIGEEIGWRGFLVPLLAKNYTFSAVVWISWAAWYLYHVPIILFGGYHSHEPLLFNLIVFAILLFALTLILTWLRLVSGSIWPPALFHAAHNLFVQSLFDKITTPNASGNWVTGEFGVGLALGYLVAALWVFKRASRLSNF